MTEFVSFSAGVFWCQVFAKGRQCCFRVLAGADGLLDLPSQTYWYPNFPEPNVVWIGGRWESRYREEGL